MLHSGFFQLCLCWLRCKMLIERFTSYNWMKIGKKIPNIISVKSSWQISKFQCRSFKRGKVLVGLFFLQLLLLQAHFNQCDFNDIRDRSGPVRVWTIWLANPQMDLLTGAINYPARRNSCSVWRYIPSQKRSLIFFIDKSRILFCGGWNKMFY